MLRSTVLIVIAFVGAIHSLPWEPVPRDGNWLKQHRNFVDNSKKKRDSINVLFYEDSITAGWNSAGKAIYAKDYEPLGAANYGISGDKTEHVLWRILNGEVAGLHPKVVVLKIGTNNRGDTPDNVAKGVSRIVKILRSKLPNSKVLLLGILPRTDATWFARVRDINRNIARLHDGVHVHFLDMFDQFVVSPTNVNPVLFTTDKVHLVTAGYQKWADTMRKLLQKLLKD